MAMGSKLQDFVHRGSAAPEGAQSAVTAQDHITHREHDRSQQPSRLGTAQRTHGNQKHPEDIHAYDTDGESFDQTHHTLNDEQYVDPNAQHGQSDYGDEDEDGNENEHAARPGQFNHGQVEHMMNRMKQQTNQHTVLGEDPDSYPPTTLGEPETEYELETHYERRPLLDGQRSNHAATASQRCEVQAAIVPQQQSLKMASIVTPDIAVHQRRGAHQQLQKAPQAIPKPYPVQSQVPRQSPADLAQGPRKKPDPRDFHVQQQTVSTLIGQGQSHVDADEDHEMDQDELDYDLEELYKKDFASLQEEAFDGPPSENTNGNSSKSASQSLEQKLAAAAKQKPDGQRNFFASLDINEWDEAGDWFQERFSNILNRLRQARKQKRHLSRQFESEVLERQQALVRKRKITDEAMDEMKASGTAVLQNTPKKKHKHTR